MKIGSRVRCTDDGVAGRIVWCNAVSVKVRWDDGEEVTWRRDSLADRPIEILDAAGDYRAANGAGDREMVAAILPWGKIGLLPARSFPKNCLFGVLLQGFHL